jgi:uncharacterized protein with GYD domain
MANYVSLLQFTEQGIRAAKDTTKRAEAVKAQAAKMGVKVTDILWTLGAYDGVLIAEGARRRNNGGVRGQRRHAGQCQNADAPRLPRGGSR